jgi:quinol monooxygenase YgiN
MNSGKVTVMAIFRAKPGKEEEVKQSLLALIEATRQEAGCINYDLHQSVDTPGLFMFYENWRSKADLVEHGKSPRLKDFMSKGRELFSEPGEITLWEMISPSA